MERLDIGCVLQAGAFEVSYTESTSQMLDLSAPDTALIFFFLRLLRRLQQMGNVSAMDLIEYSRILGAGTR
jgi:hypothetical protein